MSKVERQLGQMLVDRRLLTKDALETHLAQAESSNMPLAQILVAEGTVRESDILAAVAARIDVPYAPLEVTKGGDLIDAEAVGSLARAIADELQALPLRVENGSLVVAVADPFNHEKKSLLEKASGLPVVLALAPKAAIADRIAEIYETYESLPPDAKNSKGSVDAKAVLAEAEALTDIEKRPHVNDLLEVLIDRKGSDLHLTAGSSPQIRVNGRLTSLDQFPMMKPAMLRSMIYEILTARQQEHLEETRELDCSHPLPGKGRFRVNVFFQRDSVGAVMRAIPSEVIPLHELGLPNVVSEFATFKKGMVVVTGPTGSGKSTTLASLIDLINSTRPDHIMTVEDPIEFMHKHKMSIVNQREVGADTLSFDAALKHVLRQDPDVVLVGEMRDLETIATAITAAETGHLVFATLHTQNAPKTVERMIDVFPAHQQQQVRVQLASSIQAVLSQQLVPTADGKGRVAAVEVMVATPAIRNLIREAKIHQIASQMQAGAKYGMITMEAALADLVRSGKITRETAIERAEDQEGLESLLGG